MNRTVLRVGAGVVLGALVLLGGPAMGQGGKERLAREAYRTGMTLYDEEDWSGAVLHFERSLDLVERASVRVMMASALARQGKCERVGEVLGKVVWNQIPKGSQRNAARQVAEEAQALCRSGGVPSGDSESGPPHRSGDSLKGMVRVSGGRFSMGSSGNEDGRDEDEGPVHPVTLSRPFLMGRTEVTQRQWEEVMGNNPSRFVGCGPDCPVETVSWWDALAFCNALSRREGLQECYTLLGCSGAPGTPSFQCQDVRFIGTACLGYRLPTEAEWEYAARAGSSEATPEGPLVVEGLHRAPVLEPMAWYGGNSGVDYEGAATCSSWISKQTRADWCGTHPVGVKKANRFGFEDMLGNVSEWVFDFYAPYSEEALVDPRGPSRGTERVIRGGAWNAGAILLRLANREMGPPTLRLESLGFRVVRGLSR